MAFPADSTVHLADDAMYITRITVESAGKVIYRSTQDCQGWATDKTAKKHAVAFAERFGLAYIGRTVPKSFPKLA